MNILPYSAIRLPWRMAKPIFPIFSNPKTHYIINNRANFSQYFREKDTNDVFQYENKIVMNKKYHALKALWQKPLAKKRLRQARIKEIKANLKEPQPQVEKFIVHNPALGIKSPPQPQNIFAVVKINGRQFKITNDCVILLDTVPEHQINKNIVFQEVLLVGTDTYTLLGRPIVTNAKIEGTIQSISKSEKVLVFKKKRRKQYKRSFGSRISLTSVRINNIVHRLSEQILNKAVPL